MTTKALLVVSFGTSHADTREKTIDRLEAELAKAFPNRRLYRAWTSGMILRRLDGQVDSVSQALERMARDGIRDVLVQPTHVLDGVENGLMRDDVLACRDRLDAIRIGDPLLANDGDLQEMAEIMAGEFADLPDDEALVLMGHGTSRLANALYVALEYRLHDIGRRNIFVATVEAYPKLENAIRGMESAGRPRSVTLAPFMVVAGDHAKSDMAGDGDHSWRNVLERRGYAVRCVLRGLGELPQVADMLVRHAKAAETGAAL